MDAGAHPDPISSPRRGPRLSDAKVEAIGTILAAIGRMLRGAIGGFAHLVAAAAMLVLDPVIATLLRGRRAWTWPDRMPAFHRRWLVASPARWAAP